MPGICFDINRQLLSQTGAFVLVQNHKISNFNYQRNLEKSVFVNKTLDFMCKVVRDIFLAGENINPDILQKKMQ